jgi:hypothetical protein
VVELRPGRRRCGRAAWSRSARRAGARRWRRCASHGGAGRQPARGARQSRFAYGLGRLGDADASYAGRRRGVDDARCISGGGIAA